MAAETEYYLQHRARMQRKVEQTGFIGFSEVEVLEYLLYFVFTRIDTKPIAHELIHTFGSFSNVLQASEKELIQVKGIGPKAARFLHSQMLLFNYYCINQNKDIKSLNTPALIGHYCSNLYGANTSEQFYVIFLDNSLRIIKCSLISEGTVGEVLISSRQIAQSAIRCNASNVVVSHNHPTGKAEPSEADIASTNEIAKALQVLDIQLIDHIIVAGGNCFSFAEHGLLYGKS